MKSCPGGEFPVEAKVAALMGGLGRTINGSYAEYTRARVSNVALIESDLSRAELAAIPETYATAWTCLFRNLEIAKGQTLVVRGGLSSFGQAAVNMAVNAGARVIATTRSGERSPRLEALGAAARGAGGAGSVQSHRRSEAARRSARSCRQQHHPRFPRHAAPGRPCVPSRLAGGLEPIKDFIPLLQMSSGVYLTFFGSFVFGTPGFPLSDVPLQEIAQDVAAGRLKNQAGARVRLRGDPRSASHHGGR